MKLKGLKFIGGFLFIVGMIILLAYFFNITGNIIGEEVTDPIKERGTLIGFFLEVVGVLLMFIAFRMECALKNNLH